MWPVIAQSAGVCSGLPVSLAFRYAPCIPSFDWPMRRVARKAYGLNAKRGRRMRQMTAAAALTAIGLLVAACGGNDQSSPASSTKTTTTTPTPTPTQPPVAQAALPNLLLSPAEVDSALGM